MNFHAEHLCKHCASKTQSLGSFQEIIRDSPRDLVQALCKQGHKNSDELFEEITLGTTAAWRWVRKAASYAALWKARRF